MGNLNRFIYNAIAWKNAGLFLVVYDISSDSERKAIDKIISGYGFRIQKSVFECRILKSQVKKMIQKLEKMRIETGNIRIYRIDSNAKCITIGDNPGNGENLDEHAYIV